MPDDDFEPAWSNGVPINEIARELKRKTHEHKVVNDKIETVNVCCCIGPQNGQPLCPCRMRSEGVFQRDGQWIRPEKVLGPVRPESGKDYLQMLASHFGNAD